MIRSTFIGRAAAIVLLAGLLAVSWANGPEAAAHAEFVGSAPADGQVVSVLPSEVRAWFTEDVAPLADGLEVWSPSGKRVDDGNPTQGATTKSIRVGLAQSPEEGTFTVVWRVISVDGHPIQGSFEFSVGAPSAGGGGQHLPGDTPQWVAVAGSSARGLAYGLGLATIGLVTLATALGRSADADRQRLLRMARMAALTLIPAVCAVVATEVLAITRGDAGALGDAATREAAWNARHLPSAAIVICGAIGLLAATLAAGRWRSAPVMLEMAVIAVGFAWSGHAAAEPARIMWIAVDALHVASTGAWFGGLVGLTLLGFGRLRAGEDLGSIPSRFSRIATVAVPSAVATGVAMALVVGPGIGNLLETTYGRLLVAKVALVAATVALGAVNRQVLLPRLRAGSKPRGALARLVRAEVVALIVVVGVTATLVGQSPVAPRADAPEVPPELFDGSIGPYHFVFGTTPARPGENDITIDFHILGDTATDTPSAVQLSISRPGRSDAPVVVELREVGPGRFIADEVEFPAAGTWNVTMNIEVPGSDDATLTVPLEIAASGR